MDFLVDLKDFLIELVYAFADMMRDFLSFVFEQLMNLGILIFDGIFASLSFLNPSSYFNALPDEVSNVLIILGIGQCFSIILAATFVKILLQLIPFVRFGAK